MSVKTAYVEHPVTKQEKKAFNSKGFIVVDARFAPNPLPKGDKIVLKEKAAEAEKVEKTEETE